MRRASFVVFGYATVVAMGCGGSTERRGASGGATGSGGGHALAGNAGLGASDAGGTNAGTGGGPTKPTGGASSRGGSSSGGADSCAPRLSCPCGCCPGTTTDIPSDCDYPEYAGGRASSGPGTDCSQGCSFGRLFACCTSAPIGDARLAEYSASYVPDFGGRIDVVKKEPSGNCARFELTPGTNTLPSLSSAWLRWNGQGSYGRCDKSSDYLTAIGLEGSIETIPVEGGCQLSVHVTLFIGAPELSVLAIPVHAELSEPLLPGDLCPGI